VPALSASEAQARAALLSVDSYDVALDLTAVPVRSHTVIRFRCATPGAESFADLTAPLAGGGAVLNGVPLRPPVDGRLALPGLAADNTLTVDCAVPEGTLITFADPSGEEYRLAWSYPTRAPGQFACFDQPDLLAPLKLTLHAPADWTCVANGALTQRPAAGQAGPWRFAPVRLKPLDFSWCAGPLRSVPVPGPSAAGLTLTSYARAARGEATGGYLARYCELTAAAIARHQRELGVPLPYPGCDIVALPDVPFKAACVPGLMLVSEDLLPRLADPDDDFAAMITAHETAHLWFGNLVGMRWWDDLWLEEALATYLGYWADSGWATFSWDEKPRALLADQLPTSQPVSSPVATMEQALDRPTAVTYAKGAAVVRQLAALIGPDTVTRGLADYLTRFAPAGSASLDDLIGCWSRAAGRDLTDWADTWLRTAGTPSLAATLTAGPGGTIAALNVRQDPPRPHRVGVALYDRAGGPGHPLRHRRTELAELDGAETRLDQLAGEPLPAAVFVNAGDWALAQVTLDQASLAALAESAFDVGDPLTEAALWNAAWHMVRSGHLAVVEYVALAARRLAGAPGSTPLTPAAAEALLDRAVTAADRYGPAEARVALRTAVAGVALGAALVPGVSAPLHRALLIGLAASAQGDVQLAAVRTLLDGAPSGPVTGTPAAPPADLALRGALVRALARHGQARPADLDGLTAADPVAGQPLRAAAEAARPDAAAKEAAWTAALDPGTSPRIARAYAEGFWIPGQDSVLAGYRARYFAEALPLLAERDGRGEKLARRLARSLFPVTLDDPATLAAARGALDGGGLTSRIRAVLLEEEAELRTARAIRSF
jgi:aminopeptidase N